MRIFKIFIVVLLLEVYNNKAMCGACHVLKAAASEGDIGPNLDSLKPSEEQVKGVVTEGLGVMPAFGEEGLLTSEEIDAVSYYVVNSAGK
jgi:cytochrome c6